jgi:hypothetical protein
MPDEGAFRNGKGGQLVEHGLGALEAEEHLMYPSGPNFGVHWAAGSNEREGVGGGGDAQSAYAATESSFTSSYEHRGEEVGVNLEPQFRRELHKVAFRLWVGHGQAGVGFLIFFEHAVNA